MLTFKNKGASGAAYHLTLIWAAALKGTKSCRTQEGFCSLVSSLKSALSGLESALPDLESALPDLQSALSGLKSALSSPKSGGGD